MAISEHEKELIDYAAERIRIALSLSNPWPLDTPAQLMKSIDNAVDKSAHNMSIDICNTLRELNKQNIQQAKEADLSEERRHQETIRTTYKVSIPVAIFVTLIAELIKAYL